MVCIFFFIFLFLLKGATFPFPWILSCNHPITPFITFLITYFFALHFVIYLVICIEDVLQEFQIKKLKLNFVLFCGKKRNPLNWQKVSIEVCDTVPHFISEDESVSVVIRYGVLVADQEQRALHLIVFYLS